MGECLSHVRGERPCTVRTPWHTMSQTKEVTRGLVMHLTWADENRKLQQAMETIERARQEMNGDKMPEGDRAMDTIDRARQELNDVRMLEGVREMNECMSAIYLNAHEDLERTQSAIAEAGIVGTLCSWIMLSVTPRPANGTRSADDTLDDDDDTTYTNFTDDSTTKSERADMAAAVPVTNGEGAEETIKDELSRWESLKERHTATSEDGASAGLTGAQDSTGVESTAEKDQV